MPRRFYVKDTSNPSDPVRRVRLVLWFDVPPARQASFADPAKQSAVDDVTPAELADLRAGKLAETVDWFQWSDRPGDYAIVDRLKELWKARRAEVLGVNRGADVFLRPGMSYDPVADVWTGGA